VVNHIKSEGWVFPASFTSKQLKASHGEKGHAARKQRHGAGASVRLSQPKA
jgi:hypothetical protein